MNANWALMYAMRTLSVQRQSPLTSAPVRLDMLATGSSAKVGSVSM